MPGDIGGVSSNLVGDDAIFHIFIVWQAEVLFRSDIAEHRGAVPPDHGGADRAGDVIVAGSDVRHQWPECVERRSVAKLDFFIDLFLDLVHGHMTWTFDHHLYILLPSLFRELSKSRQFGELRFVARVGNASRTQAIAQ